MTDEESPRYPPPHEGLRDTPSEQAAAAHDETYDDNDVYDDDEAGDFISLEGLTAALSEPSYDFFIALGLSLVLTYIGPDARYAFVWTVLLAIGAGSYFLSGRARSEDAVLGNLFGGAGYGLVIGLPVVLLLEPALELTSGQLFAGMSDTTVYLFLVFAMPISETLFFRGMMQEAYGFRTAALSGAAWSAVLFAPNLDAIAEVIVVSIAMLALNFAYAYVRERYGLAASWLSQTIVSVLALLVPRVL